MISKSIGIIQRLLNAPPKPFECFPANHTINDEELLEIRHDINDLDLYRKIEEELGIDLYTFFTVKRRGYIYYKALDGSVRKSKVWAQFFGYDWCWYIRNPKKKDRKRVRMKHYGKTWALTEEELK